MKKKIAKGFTLVEIMVVIVIMGILAAVAVPKLFGSIAKAKASEIAPAAGTYQRLQDVHIASYGSVGTWNSIGYVAPGSGKTNNFTYCGGEITENIDAGSFGEMPKVGWQATNNAGLNGCSAGSWWFVTIKPESANIVYYATETSAQECVALAKPNWVVASRSGMSCGAAGSVAETTLKPTDVGYTMTIGASKPGGWSSHAYGTFNENVSSTQLGTYNENSDDGLFVLQPNSTYEYVVEVPEESWDEESGKYLQASAKLYSKYDDKNKQIVSILIGSVTNKAEEDPNKTGYLSGTGTVNGGNGYNTGSEAAKQHEYTASSNIEHTTNEKGQNVVRTTISITTGDDGGKFGANFYAPGGMSTSQKETALDAITKSSLTLVSKKDETTANSSSSK